MCAAPVCITCENAAEKAPASSRSSLPDVSRFNHTRGAADHPAAPFCVGGSCSCLGRRNHIFISRICRSPGHRQSSPASLKEPLHRGYAKAVRLQEDFFRVRSMGLRTGVGFPQRPGRFWIKDQAHASDPFPVRVGGWSETLIVSKQSFTGMFLISGRCMKMDISCGPTLHLFG